MNECQSRIISAIDQLCDELKQAKTSSQCDSQLIDLVNRIETEVLSAKIRLNRQRQVVAITSERQSA